MRHLYQAGFTAEGGNWQTLRLPLAAFRASFRGRDVAGAPPLDPDSIRQVGLMIAARQAGAFALDIRRIGLTGRRGDEGHRTVPRAPPK